MAADDDAASGPPPHPLDRVWFHPSELGGGTALAPRPTSTRTWVVAAVALAVGMSATLGIVAATGGLRARSSAIVARAVLPVSPEPDDVAGVVGSVGRSIVTLTATATDATDAVPTWIGSGVVVGSGRVLTAAHLVDPATTVSVVTSGGQVAAVQVVGMDLETDLALLRIDGADLAPARLSTGDDLRVGQRVVTLGAGPAPRRWAATGVISGLDAVAPLADGVQGVALIATDAAVDPHLAGGALLDASGAVVGILTGPGAVAVPIDIARDVVAQLGAGGRAFHGWAGIVGTDALDRPGGGVRVRAVTSGGPAATAGLAEGDVVLKVGDRAVGNVGDLAATVRRLKPGDPVSLTVVRGGTRVEIPVRLGTSVATPADWMVVA